MWLALTAGGALGGKTLVDTLGETGEGLFDKVPALCTRWETVPMFIYG